MEERIELIKSIEPSWLQRKCRRLVHNTLDKLTGCQIELHEPGGTLIFGEQSDDPERALVARIQVNDISAYQDFVRHGDIGAADAFISRKWDSDNLTDVIRVFARSKQNIENLQNRSGTFSRFVHRLRYALQHNSISGSKKNILSHYDLGNNLFTQFLDESMMYSSAVFEHEQQTLEAAQKLKLTRICEQLDLGPEDHLLEIGSGWGGMAIFAAKNYGCQVTTTTISDAQHEFALQRIKEAGLESQITLLKKDYRELTGRYDKIVSIEMIEAVGYQYLDTFFQQCESRLKPGGKMLLQAITMADQHMDFYRKHVDFIQHYIFPGGFLPSVSLLTSKLTRNTSMITEGLVDIGQDYALTLQHWRHRFISAWPALSTQGYDDQFKRLWLYYLCYCEGAFMEQNISTVHFLARKPRH